jgi:glucosyl-3-phosphoglycerate synthase
VAAVDEAPLIAPAVTPLVALRDAGLIDQVVVIDGASPDSMMQRMRALGAEVRRPAALLPGFGRVLGRGDALWRALSVLEGDLVCFVDPEPEGIAEAVWGLLGPLVDDPAIQFVTAVGSDGGGRVGALTARPLLDAFYPELSALRQPLSTEFAARRDLLEELAFATGHGVEIGLLLDACASAGLDAVAQVEIGARRDRQRPLERERPMAADVLGAVTQRLRRDGRLAGGSREPEVTERPARGSAGCSVVVRPSRGSR